MERTSLAGPGIVTIHQILFYEQEIIYMSNTIYDENDGEIENR